MTIRHHIRILLIAMLIVSATSALPQSAPTKEEPNKGVEILATMDNPSVCLGTDHLRVLIVVINRSAKPVELDVSRLSTSAGFVALIDTTEMKFRTQTFSVNGDRMGSARPPAKRVLPPKGSFEREIQLPMRDLFFSKAGYYRVDLSSSVRVGEAAHRWDVFASSSMIFELRDCEPQ